MRFIVEVPVYLKLEVDAPDATEAARIGETTAAHGPLVQDLADVRVVRSEIVPLDPEEEDRSPDVYVCRGGRLAAVNDEGWIEPLDEAC